MGRLVKILSAIIVVFGIIGILILQFLISDFNPWFNNTTIEKLSLYISESDNLPESFVRVYNDVSPITPTPNVLLNWKRSKYGSSCPCLHVANMFLTPDDARIVGDIYILSLKLERRVSQEQCLSFLVKHHDFLYGNTTISEASKFYFDEEFGKLSERQYATLVLMLQNPSFYNPKTRQEILDDRLKQLNY